MKCKKKDENKLKHDIISSSKAIREKLKNLKMNKTIQEDDFNEKFKPIVDPLKQLVMKQNYTTPHQDVNKTEKDRVDEDDVALSQLKELGNIASKYIIMHLGGKKTNVLDNIYGIRFEISDWMLGNMFHFLMTTYMSVKRCIREPLVYLSFYL
jgi:hypothetical protein